MAVVNAPRSQSFSDPVIGFEVDKPTRHLILTFFTVAFLLVFLGAVAALLVALTRAPMIKLLNPADYYTYLTFHGILMLTMFPHVFEAGLLVYTSTVLLRTKAFSVKLGWLGLLVAAIGIAMILFSVLTGQSSVLYTAYVPMRAFPLFYLGHIIYAVGVLIILILFALNVVKARLSGSYTGTLPLATYGMATAAIIALVAIISAVVAFVPATLWAFRILDFKVDPLTYKAAFWGMGHTLQYTNVTSMVVAWYAIGAFALRSKAVSEKFSRYAFALYLLTTVPVFAHHLLVDPTWTPAFKWLGATFVGIILGIASSAHGIAVPASIEANLRRKGARGLFGFLKNWGWSNPAMVLLFFSLVLFGIGGFDGTIATTSQLNMILHNTMWIPAHIHGALAGGLAVAFMGVSYYILPALGVRIRGGRAIALLQAYLVGFGFLLMSIFMHWAAQDGVPRRTQDITYPGFEKIVPDWFTAMNFVGIAGTVAAVGIMIFALIMLVSVLTGATKIIEAKDNVDLGVPVMKSSGRDLVGSRV